MLELQHVGVTTIMDFEEQFFDCYARTFPYLIDKASVYIGLRGSNLLNELGADITLEQFITLDAISANNELCQRDLAKILLKERSNVTRIINILENKGLITRQITNKGNRAVKITHLTGKGYEVMNNYGDKMKSDLNELLSQFDPLELSITEKVLREISKKISENVKIQI